VDYGQLASQGRLQVAKFDNVAYYLVLGTQNAADRPAKNSRGDLAPVNDNGVYCYGVRRIKIYIIGGRLVTISSIKILPKNFVFVTGIKQYGIVE
jgi:hypothetical protein